QLFRRVGTLLLRRIPARIRALQGRGLRQCLALPSTLNDMDETVHIAITRRVRKEHAKEFERLLADFAGRTLNDPNSRGVQLLFPPPGSDSNEYGILRSFATRTGPCRRAGRWRSSRGSQSGR